MATVLDPAWLAQVPESISELRIAKVTPHARMSLWGCNFEYTKVNRKDPLWSFDVYPKALLLSDLVWEDTGLMIKDARGKAVAQQLIRPASCIFYTFSP